MLAADAPDGPQPPSATPLRWIDAHCHVFNAADLPVAEFIEYTRLHSVFDLPVYPILQIIAALYKLPVMSAKSELAQLGGGATPGAPPAPLTTLQALYALRGSTAPGGDPTAAISLRLLNNGARLLQDTLSELDPARPADQPLTDEDHVALASKLDSDNPSAGEGAATNEDLLTWVNMLAQPRAHITGQLLSQFPAGANVMITPALVDYNRWLGIDTAGDNELSSLNDQVAVMAAVAERCAGQGKVMASFAPFDPWRSIEDPTVLIRLQDWLQKGLAVGVKIYPPMGFSAAGNGTALPPPALPPPTPPEALRQLVQAKYPGMTVGAALDAEMNKLFELCEALDVPLMAHCARSELANPGNADLPGPDYWRLALTNWPNLRLNLGHFGGVWQFSATDNDPAGVKTTTYAQTWARSIAQLMHDFSNVYADVAYFDLALVDPVPPNSPTAQALEFIAELAQDYPMLVDRLMYGSDWIMVAIVTASSDYVRRLTNAIDTIFGDDLARENLLWRNAARYLGLRATDKTRARLATVLGAQAGLLDPFDPGA
jgi:hypothetical protein